MSDADLARATKHLGSIDHSLKELVKVIATMNVNFVELVKFLKAEIDDSQTSSWEGHANQLALQDQGTEDTNG